MADYENIIEPERTEIIPSYIAYPRVSINTDSNLQKKDKVIIRVRVEDKDGIEKFLDNTKIVLKEFPQGKKLRCVVKVRFFEEIEEKVMEE